MLVYDVFLALQAPAISSFLNETLTQNELEFTHRKKVAYCRRLSDKDQIPVFEKFIVFCTKTMEGFTQKNWLDILFEYYGETTLHQLDLVNLCDKLTQLFVLHLPKDSPLDIAQMGCAFFDRPVVFIAFIRYLLKSGASTHDLLTTHLLQDLFRYDYISLGLNQNQISFCFNLLDYYPETVPLAEASRRIRCNEPIFQSYALDGHVRDQLEMVEKRLGKTQFNHRCYNDLSALYDFFKIDYLRLALIQHSNQTAPLSSFQIEQFNKTNVIQRDLPILLDSLIDTPLLEHLANILRDDTVLRLVHNHVIGVNSLLPYSPYLTEIIQSEDLVSYLENIRRNNPSTTSIIHHLMALLSHIKKTNTDASTLILNAIIDTTLQNPIALDDHIFIRKIRKYPQLADVVYQKVKCLENRLKTLCDFQTNGQVNDMDYITIEDTWRTVTQNIRLLEEITLCHSEHPKNKFELIRHLLSLFITKKTTLNIHELANAFKIEPELKESDVTVYQRFLIELLVSVDDDIFREQLIDTLNQALNDSWRLKSYGDICLYRHAAQCGNIGLMYWLKNQKIKSSVTLATLTIEAAKNNQWLMVNYFLNNQNVIHKNGRLGPANNSPSEGLRPATCSRDPEILSNAKDDGTEIEKFGSREQVAGRRNLNCKQHLDKKTINTLLNLVIEKKAAHSIPYFSCLSKSQLPFKTIEKKFKQASLKNDIELIHAFLKYFKLSDSIITNVFKDMIKSRQFEIAILITTYHDGKLIKEAIGQILFKAARLNQCDTIDTLMQISSDFFCKAWIANAHLAAIKARRIEAGIRLEQLKNQLDATSTLSSLVIAPPPRHPERSEGSQGTMPNLWRSFATLRMTREQLPSLNPDTQNLMTAGQTKSQGQALGRHNLNHFFQPACELDKGVSQIMLSKPSPINR